MSHKPTTNTGGGGIYANKATARMAVESITLDGIIQNAGTVKLLKIDCEGAEYEILLADPSLLDNVEWLVGEIHTCAEFEARGWTPERLLETIHEHIDPSHVRMTTVHIGEGKHA